MTTTEITETTRVDWAQQAREHDRNGTINTEAFDMLRRNGSTKALVPVEFGGLGKTHAEMGAMLRAIARSDPATAVTLSMHSHLVAAQVWRHHHGLDATRDVLEGRRGVRDLGEHRRVRLGGVERLGATGRRWLPSQCTQVAREWMRSRHRPRDELPLGRGAGSTAGAPLLGADGGSRREHRPHLGHSGQRATGSHTVVLDDVFVPDGAISLARPADQWHPVWNTVLGAALPLIMSAYLGIADAAVATAQAHVAGRTEQHVLQLLGEMLNAHTTAADVVAAMYVDADNLHFDNTDAIVGRMLSRKTVATDAVIETVRLAIEATGGLGYTRSSDLERLYRDAHGALFHPLGRGKQTTFSGRVAQGLSPLA